MGKIMTKHCLPCTGSTAKLKHAEQQAFLKFVHPDWIIVDQHHLERSFKFPDFKEALSFANKIGAIAEEERHHPDIHLSYGNVRVTIWTHKIDGLSESDFILASKIDAIVLSKKVCF